MRDCQKQGTRSNTDTRINRDASRQLGRLGWSCGETSPASTLNPEFPIPLLAVHFDRNIRCSNEGAHPCACFVSGWKELGGWPRLSPSFYSRGCPVQARLGGDFRCG